MSTYLPNALDHLLQALLVRHQDPKVHYPDPIHQSATARR
jgi:hypothetical protein